MWSASCAFTPFSRKTEIAGIEQRDRASSPEQREAQKALAYAVTAMVHGEDVARDIQHAAEIVYDERIQGIGDRTLRDVFASVPTMDVAGGAISTTASTFWTWRWARAW